jgi:16S rRNA (uracil1498-N3)-methyltransferase
VSRVRLHVAADRFAERVRLDASQKKHLIDVLRLGPGDKLEVFDGQGSCADASLVRIEAGWFLELGALRQEQAAGPQVWLGVGLLKGRKLDEVVRAVTEVGVCGVQPFTSSRSVPRPNAKRLRSRLERWRTIAAEAARQSGRSRVPQIVEPVKLEVLLAKPPVCTVFMLHESEPDLLLDDCLLGLESTARLVLVGPEGGFSAAEVQLAVEFGAGIAGLGLPILRAQTAAVIASAFACRRTKSKG